jgi:hypothetical protein
MPAGVKKVMKAMKSKFARMDERNRALCWALRHAPKGKPTKFSDIAKLVRKMDGKRPKPNSVQQIVKTFLKPREAVGRKPGWRKTTKDEDGAIIKTFHKVRPPGHGVDSRV